MPALAMGLGWAGYALGLWGYCLVRGYNVTLMELVDFRHVPTWSSITASHVPSGSTLPVPGGLDSKNQPLTRNQMREVGSDAVSAAVDLLGKKPSGKKKKAA